MRCVEVTLSKLEDFEKENLPLPQLQNDSAVHLSLKIPPPPPPPPLYPLHMFEFVPRATPSKERSATADTIRTGNAHPRLLAKLASLWEKYDFEYEFEMDMQQNPPIDFLKEDDAKNESKDIETSVTFFEIFNFNYEYS